MAAPHQLRGQSPARRPALQCPATCRPGDTPTSCRPWSTERRGRRSATGTAGAREDSAGARPWLHAQTRKGACESSEPRSGECDAEDSSVSGPLRLSFLICKTEMTGPSSKGACVRLAHRGFSWWPCPAAHCKKSSGHSEEGAWLLDAEKPQGDWPTAQDTILLGIRQNCTFIFKTRFLLRGVRIQDLYSMQEKHLIFLGRKNSQIC